MQPTDRKKQPDLELDKLWERIIEAFDGNDDLMVSLRIPALIMIYNSGQLSWKRVFRDIRSIFKAFFIHEEHPRLAKSDAVFLVPYGSPSNAGNIIPLVKASIAEGIRTGVIWGGDFSDPELAQTPTFNLNALRMSPDRWAMWRVIRGSLITWKKSIRAAAMASGGRVSSGDRLHLLNQVVTSIRFRMVFQNLFRHQSPGVVVSSSDFWPLEYHFIRQAQQAGVMTFVVQHGVVSNFWWPFTSDYYLVWGSLYKKKLQELGAPSGRILICGMPASDSLFHDVRKPVDAYQHVEGRPKCLILSQTSASAVGPELIFNFLTMLDELMSLCTSHDFIVRLHPREDGSRYGAIKNKHGDRFRLLPREMSLKESIQKANVAGTLYSTAGLEAMILDKPLMVFNLGREIEEFAWWPINGGGTYVHNSREAAAFLDRAEYDTAFRDRILASQNTFLQECFAHQGQSIRTIVARITDMAPETR